MNSYLDTTTFYIIAHRGGAAEAGATENSLAAFEYTAANSDKAYLACDVRMGEDGRLYLWHESTAKIPNRPLKIGEKAPFFTPDELFARFPDNYFTVDPKDTLCLEPLADLITRYNLHNQICIGAAFDARARRVADLVEANTGKRPFTALVSANASLELLTNPWALRKRKLAYQATFIHVHRSLISPLAIQNAHKQGLRIIAWVVNKPETMQKFIDWGIDGIMTDYPKRLQNVLTNHQNAHKKSRNL